MLGVTQTVKAGARCGWRGDADHRRHDAAAPHAVAQSTEIKPYDDRLMRLSEVLGAVHYLRELCGANDGQIWRERMQELMNAEGSSALRTARLTRCVQPGLPQLLAHLCGLLAFGQDRHRPLHRRRPASWPRCCSRCRDGRAPASAACG